MKHMFSKGLVLLMAVVLVCTLSGCDALDYREAIRLYNNGEFDAAADLFSTLGDYEDSTALVTRSHYWAAVSAMEQGNYEAALPRFLKLDDYEDSAQRVTECRYQLAIAALEAGDLSDAETAFLELSGYRQSTEYLRRINWQRLFDAVAAAGPEGLHSGTSEGMALQIIARQGEPDQLVFFVSREKDMGYTFYDDLTLTLPRDSLEAAFTASSTFAMDLAGTQIGSLQTASGKLDISSCTADTVLNVDQFRITGTDNLGNPIDSEDPDDLRMGEDMAENLRDLLAVIPTLLSAADIPLTLQDIGFAP